MANRRKVRRTTVMGYGYLALTQLERALSAALRSDMLEEQYMALRRSYVNLRKTLESISPERKRRS